MSNNQQPKSGLRQVLRNRRRGLDQNAHEAAAAALAHHLCAMPALANRQRIATYIASDGEIDPGPATTALRKQGHTLFLPIIQPGKTLLFAPWNEPDTLTPNRYGIPEPSPAPGLCDASELDAVLMPLVGWDSAGRRLGMGGGYYDRCLEGVEHVLKIGLAFAVQEEPALPSDAWDISLDYVVTETSTVACSGLVRDDS